MTKIKKTLSQAILERRATPSFDGVPIPPEDLRQILDAGLHAPSGYNMQPWRFIVVRDLAVRQAIHNIFLDANQQALAGYEGERRKSYAGIKLEGILEAPQNLCIVCDSESSQGHQLGRRTMPEMALYSTVCAIQNLWLAARAEGIGVGWVSIFESNLLRAALHIPEHITLVAYLCLGYVDAFSTGPDLERLGWEKRTPVKNVLSWDRYDNSWDEQRPAH